MHACMNVRLDAPQRKQKDREQKSDLWRAHIYEGGVLERSGDSHGLSAGIGAPFVPVACDADGDFEQFIHCLLGGLTQGE